MAEDARNLVAVGIDGSDDALRAMDWAADAARWRQTPLKLICAYQPFPPGWPADEGDTPAAEAERFLAAARDRLLEKYPDVAVSEVTKEGPAPRVLLEESRSATLLVVGREGLGRVAELVLGSVSMECATHAHIPVAVIPAAWTRPDVPFRRVLLGVDGSENCQKAVEYAFRLADQRRAHLEVVFAWPQPQHLPEAWPMITWSRSDAGYDRVIEQSIGTWREKFPDVVVTTHGDAGHPADVLRRRATSADLVVIGGRGHGLVTGMILGSVARAILRHVEAPMVVVHQEE